MKWLILFHRFRKPPVNDTYAKFVRDVEQAGGSFRWGEDKWRELQWRKHTESKW